MGERNPKRLTTHHYYWPRRKNRGKKRLVKMRVPYDFHMAYHHFYLTYCRTGECSMKCCYRFMCCYSKEV